MRRGQVTSGSSIAVFVFLIALFIVFYVLLLSPEERQTLLNQTVEDRASGVSGVDVDILLKQNPGILKPFESDVVKHKIDSVSLYLKEEPVTSDLATSLYLSKSLFSQDKRELIFNIDDLDNLDQVNLYFLAVDGKGNLIVSLNGIIIYESKANGLVRVVLPVDLLREANILQFSVSSLGWNFFGKNYYNLRDIKIRESYEMTNTREIRKFVLTEQEKGDANLKFYIFCNTMERGARLRVFLNDEEISSQILNCVGAEKNIDIDEDELETGENILMFEIDKGDFLINNIELEVEAEEGGYINYKFSITEDKYDEILDKDLEVVLYMDFNDDESKKATLSVNGNEFSLDTDDIDYERFITSYIKQGNNFIKIIPINEFNIDELRIEIEE